MAGKKGKTLSDKQRLGNFFQEALSASRAASPVCRHFGECGGCEFQDVPYSVQVETKRQAFDFIARDVAAALEEEAGRADRDAGQDISGMELSPAERAANLAKALDGLSVGAVPSPRQLGYRQRMDYVFAFGKAGLRRKARHRQVVELEECPLLGDEGFRAFSLARRLAEAAGLESYDYMRHHGELRYFVVRRSRNGGVLLSLVVKEAAFADKAGPVLERLFGEGAIASGHCLLAPGLGDVSFGEPLFHVGEPVIEEKVLDRRLAIGPNTFFQSNPDVAELAYGRMRDFVPAGAAVLDMYSGVGSIALCLADRAEKVLAAEEVGDNVALARRNIAENAAGNVEIVEMDATAYLASLAGREDADRPGMVVVNPPRPGVGAAGMLAVKSLAPGRFAYLSCNPFTLLRDLSHVLDRYRLVDCTVFDMFPQTRHFETLALLERI